jgi:hypothetical protein
MELRIGQPYLIRWAGGQMIKDSSDDVAANDPFQTMTLASEGVSFDLGQRGLDGLGMGLDQPIVAADQCLNRDLLGC